MGDNGESIGQRIKLHRQRRGETQAQLAARLGICRSTVIDWEGGNLPQPFARLIEEIQEAEESRGRSYQLQLPFSEPLDLAIRIAPKKATSIQVDFEWKQKNT